MAIVSSAQGVASTGVRVPQLRFRRRWILFVMVGEAVGFCVPAAAGALTAGTAWEQWQTLLLILAGVVEGALLGAAQALAARPYDGRPHLWSWIAVTALGAAVAWTCGLTVSALGRSSTVPLAAFIAAAIVLGVVGLIAMPTLQWASMRSTTPQSVLWIPVNAGAWAVGVVWTLLPFPFIDGSTPLRGLIVVYALAGLFMAITVAAFTAPLARRFFAGAEPQKID
ncbi:MAG TPA: hypothetical protein DCP11_01130 [Microbacteriaceae bacterium]|nr:hypothetical protein [Microbacteriaceae bacterium]